LINYDSKKELRAFLDSRGLGMRKKFGQNFLINPVIRSRLLDALEIGSGCNVWEIGPGLGAMTKGLLERGARVTAFEIDSAFIQILREIFDRENSGDETSFTLIEGDVMKSWPGVHVVEGEDLFLLANLPYNIAAALLADFIEKGRLFKRMVVTVQKEVAQRMCAEPGSADYSSFSVLCSSVYKVSLIQTISGSSFYPAPRVDSRGVRLDLLPATKKRPALFFPLVRSLFQGRRKTIRNTLLKFAASAIIRYLPLKQQMPNMMSAREIVAEVLNRTGISGECRAETLGVAEFCALAVCMEEIISHGPYNSGQS